MKIFTVNVRHGGGMRLAKLLERFPDVDATVVTEYRDTPNGQAIRDRLRERFGYRTFAFEEGALDDGVLVAVKARAHVLETSRSLCAVDLGSLRLCGVFVPHASGKRASLERLIDGYARETDTVIIGDLNTGRDGVDASNAEPFACGDRFAALETHMVDAWRSLHPGEREYSWYARGRRPRAAVGRRVDHAFLSPSLVPGLRHCEYDQAFRTSGATDHAALVLELAVAERANAA